MSGAVVLPEKRDAVTENLRLNRSMEGFRLPGKCSVVAKAAVLCREWEAALSLQVTLNDLSELTQKS